MKYEDWCIDFFEREQGNVGYTVSEEERQSVILNVSERLVNRLNCVFDKYYGNRRFVSSTLLHPDDEMVMKVIDYIEEQQDALDQKYRKRQEEIKKIRVNGDNKLPQDEIDRKIEKKENKCYLIKKEYEKLEEIKSELAVGKYYLDDLEKEEILFFELLFDIPRNTLQDLKKGNWEILRENLKEDIIKAIQNIKDIDRWQLTEADIRRIEFKMQYPLAYKMYLLEGIIDSSKEFKENADIQKAVEKTNRAIKSLYKKTMEIDQMIMEELDDELIQSDIILDVVDQYINGDKKEE